MSKSLSVSDVKQGIDKGRKNKERFRGWEEQGRMDVRGRLRRVSDSSCSSCYSSNIVQ